MKNNVVNITKNNETKLENALMDYLQKNGEDIIISYITSLEERLESALLKLEELEK